ncbi:MAG: chemotaxis protein CheW [Nitrospinota bacterium]
MQYITFFVDDHLYGLPILALREIARFYEITPVHGVEKRVSGLLNLRGQIVTVLNMGVCLDVAPIPHDKKSRFLIIKSDNELAANPESAYLKTCSNNVALLISSIGEVVDISSSTIEKAPANLSDEAVAGVIKAEGQLITVLSTEWVCRVADMETGAV